jgi:hypothetical protein
METLTHKSQGNWSDGACMHGLSAAANRTTTRDLGWCSCVTFWLSKASHSAGSHNGGKSHHHLA